MLSLTTMYMGISLNMAQVQLIDDLQNINGFANWQNVVTNTAFVINTWLADGLLVRVYF